MITLANPWGLLILSAIPLVLYLHRHVGGERRLVPLVELWQPARRGGVHRRQRIPFDLVLLLRVLIVVAVALALARPAWPTVVARRHVLVLDASASMGAIEPTGPRFHRARDAALDVLDRGGLQDEVMIIRAGLPPTIEHPFSRDRGSVRRTLERVRPGEARKDLLAALGLVQHALAGEAATVHVFTDLRVSRDVERLARQVGLAERDVRLHAIGGPAENVAIVRLEAATLPTSPLDRAIFALIANFSRRSRAVGVTASVDGAVRQQWRLALNPGERRPLTFTVPTSDRFELRLDGHGADALTIDDRAQLVFDGTPVRVACASCGDRFLQAALRSHPRLEVVEAAGLERPATSVSTADVVITVGGASSLPLRRPSLVIGAASGARDGGGRSVPVVAWETGHPLLRGLDLADVRVPAGAVLADGMGEVLVRSAEGAVLRASARDGVRTVELAFEPERSNLVRTPAFPILVARAVDWLADREAGSRTLRAGSPFRMTAPQPGSVDVSVRRPDGASMAAHAQDGRIEFTSTEQTGLYEVTGPGIHAAFAVNLLDAEESDVARAEAPPETADRFSDADRPQFVEHARPFLAAAVPLLSIEIWLLQRRLRGRG